MHNHDHISEKPNKYIVIVILALSLMGLIYAFSKPAGKDVVDGIVKEVLSEKEIILEIGGNNKIVKEQELLVEITVEKEKKEIRVVNDFIPVVAGDKIFVSESLFGDNEFSIVDISRTKELILLSIFFVVLVFLTSGWKGFYSLIGLLFSFAVIFAYIVPQILKGVEPVSVGLVGAATILISTLYLSYGLNRKSIAAFLGIIFSLFFVGILANFVVDATQLNGLSEVSMYLDMETSSSINFVGLLIAGIIIAAVGVLDDVAAIQSSVVFNLVSVDHRLRGFKLFRKAMQVGRDHISAVVNTLILAYTGAALPLIILLYLRRMPMNYFVSLGTVAEEIIRALISSSGLLLAVPLTTIIATIMVGKNHQLVMGVSKLSEGVEHKL
ncbi:MAG: YibE/F family protein [Patescibacteria group bacterium]